mmetsp:Transcript_1179/g.2934  ORF Transcript_1179/g.2934 Transcript_1179/m.2934 type:complete len:650 (+) Transcript_1179:180-2129(+)
MSHPAGAPIARLLLFFCLPATMIAKAAASSSMRRPWRFLPKVSSSTHVATFASNGIRPCSPSHPPSRVVRFFRADIIRNNVIVDVHHRAAPPKPRTRTSIPGAIRYQSGQRFYNNKSPKSSLSSSSSSSSSDMTANEVRMTQDAIRMADAAIRAVDPSAAVRDRLRVRFADDNNRRVELVATAAAGSDGACRELVYDLSEYDDVSILSFGKASAAMAMAVAEVLESAKDSQSRESVPRVDGIVIIKDDHASDDEIKVLNDKHDIVVRSASHPVPDARSVAAANEIIGKADSSHDRTLVVACVSGGGSALFCSPRHPLTIHDLVGTNDRLLASGMPIEGMNVIRKRLEDGKGGRLASRAYPATVLTLVLSDIIGDPLDLIASGPTVPDDGSGWDDACELVEEYGLDVGGVHELPGAVLDMLRMGRDGELDDTPKSSHPAFSQMITSSSSSDESSSPKEEDSKLYSETILVGNNRAAVMAAADEAEVLGYSPIVLGTRFDGEASSVAGTYISMAEMLTRQRSEEAVRYPIAPSLPVALISGGETIVTLPPKCTGKGGRNQEAALSAAMKMSALNMRDVVFASVGTDGTDGPTDAAGAVVYGGLVNEETMADAKEALRNHDAYTFLDSVEGALVRTGPTGTNVADICITLVK